MPQASSYLNFTYLFTLSPTALICILHLHYLPPSNIIPTTNRIIAIIGPTAVGKTKLGIYLAKVFASEVISVDSLQCYKDGPIVTARVTPGEADGIPHHLVNYLEADEEPSTFVADALDCIETLHGRGKVPILVGGSTSLTIPLLQASVGKGKEILVIMLNSPASMLKFRIEARVDEMVNEGLLSELADLYRLERTLLGKSTPPDFARGVWKTIGYPELYPYLTSTDNGAHQAEAMAKGVAEMKRNSVGYASMQLQWTRKAFIPFLRKSGIQHIELHIGGVASPEPVLVAAIRECVSMLYEQPMEIKETVPNVTAGAQAT